MKFLGDFLPVLLFFATYFLGESAPEKAHSVALNLLGGLSRDGSIPPELSSILLASAVAIVAITVQILRLLARRKHVSPMLWTSFVIFLVFGGATIYFHNDAFIKWKPTVLYWIFGIALFVSDVFMRRNLIRAMIEPNGVAMPDALWRRLNWAWIAFFWAVGVVNLYVAFTLSRSIWVSFKSFGLTGLTLLFIVVQSVFLARHMTIDEEQTGASGNPISGAIPGAIPGVIPRAGSGATSGATPGESGVP
jgi:intracellular septation protein